MINDDAQKFKWAIRSDKIDCKHKLFGFHKEIQKIFIDKILPTLNDCSTMTWNKIQQNRHCHSWNDVSKLSKEFRDRITELFGENGPETLFQISLGNKPRIFGYKENGIFYLLFYDPEHKGRLVSKKNT